MTNVHPCPIPVPNPTPTPSPVTVPSYTPIPVPGPIRPATQSPCEELLRDGAESLTDAELLALQLPHLPAREALRKAHDALLEAGDLRRLLDLPYEVMTTLEGIGDREHVALVAAREIGRRYIATSVDKGEPVENPRALADYFTARIRHKTVEHFLVLFLDTRHQVLGCEEASHGTIDGTAVYEREVVRRALHHHAAAVVFAHNHPSGRSLPSETDRKLTRDLAAALALVRVRVLDHLIVGEGTVYSFGEHGLL